MYQYLNPSHLPPSPPIPSNHPAIPLPTRDPPYHTPPHPLHHALNHPFPSYFNPPHPPEPALPYPTPSHPIIPLHPIHHTLPPTTPPTTPTYQCHTTSHPTQPNPPPNHTHQTTPTATIPPPDLTIPPSNPPHHPSGSHHPAPFPLHPPPPDNHILSTPHLAHPTPTLVVGIIFRRGNMRILGRPGKYHMYPTFEYRYQVSNMRRASHIELLW